MFVFSHKDRAVTGFHMITCFNISGIAGRVILCTHSLVVAEEKVSRIFDAFPFFRGLIPVFEIEVIECDFHKGRYTFHRYLCYGF